MILEKLKILQDSKVIDEDTYQFALNVLANFKELELIQADNEADVFLTHLAMADSRRKLNDYSIGEMDKFILDEVEKNEHYMQSKEIWESISKKYTRDNFSDNEKHYIYLHLTNLLNKE
ncbi:MAG: PRD domain-containing protein [Aerococcaceae bacterium]|nr:PRD domain-containing protein [Aerococcaceae bacterium]